MCSSCHVIFDRFKAQFSPTVFQVLKENHIFVALVPENSIDRLQPMGISVNKSVKQFLRCEFHDWYASQICSQLHTSKKIQPVHLHLTTVKQLSLDLSGCWIILQPQTEFAINSFYRTVWIIALYVYTTFMYLPLIIVPFAYNYNAFFLYGGFSSGWHLFTISILVQLSNSGLVEQKVLKFPPIFDLATKYSHWE